MSFRIALIFALLAVLAGSGWVHTCSRLDTAQRAAQAAQDSLRDERQARADERATAIRTAARLSKEAAEARKRAATVAKAVAADPEWANTPLPQEVADALR